MLGTEQRPRANVGDANDATDSAIDLGCSWVGPPMQKFPDAALIEVHDPRGSPCEGNGDRAPVREAGRAGGCSRARPLHDPSRDISALCLQ